MVCNTVIVKESARVSLEIVVHYVRNGLRVCRRARSATVDTVMDMRELVCYTVRLCHHERTFE